MSTCQHVETHTANFGYGPSEEHEVTCGARAVRRLTYQDKHSAYVLTLAEPELVGYTREELQPETVDLCAEHAEQLFAELARGDAEDDPYGLAWIAESLPTLDHREVALASALGLLLIVVIAALVWMLVPA